MRGLVSFRNDRYHGGLQNLALDCLEPNDLVRSFAYLRRRPTFTNLLVKRACLLGLRVKLMRTHVQVGELHLRDATLKKSSSMPNQNTVNELVRQTILTVAQPLTVGGKQITNRDQVDPGWNIGLPFPIGLDAIRSHILVIHLNLLVKSLKPRASFGPGDLKGTDTVGDVQDTVWSKVKPS